MKVTIKDIAAVAGVSHSTVSRALNDSPQISQGTKDKIKQIAKAMNFEFNSGARTLKGVKTGNIAVIYETHHEQFGSSLYINQLFIELRHVLEKMDMDSIIIEGYHPDTGASNIERLVRQQKVDGFLIVHGEIANRDYKFIIDSGFPLVQLHMRPKFYDETTLNFFTTNNYEGGRCATEHLIGVGCKKIITISPDEGDSFEYADRTAGYRKALQDNKIDFECYLKADCSYNGGYNVLKDNLELIKSVDGIFFQTDVQAFGFINAAKEHGIKIPQKLKVIGYDDTPVCEYTDPLLSTIHQPKFKLAKLAAERIIDLINKENCEIKTQEVLLPTLTLRESC